MENKFTHKITYFSTPNLLNVSGLMEQEIKIEHKFLTVPVKELNVDVHLIYREFESKIPHEILVSQSVYGINSNERLTESDLYYVTIDAINFLKTWTPPVEMDAILAKSTKDLVSQVLHPSQEYIQHILIASVKSSEILYLNN